MKTDQAERLDIDYGVDVTPRELPAPDTPHPARTGRSGRRVTATVLSLILLAVIAAALAWVAMNIRANQAALDDSALYDQSITAREHAPGAPAARQDSVLDRSIRARDTVAAVPAQDSLLNQSVQARESGVTAEPQESVLDQSVRARDATAALNTDSDSLLDRSIRAREQ